MFLYMCPALLASPLPAEILLIRGAVAPVLLRILARHLLLHPILADRLERGQEALNVSQISWSSPLIRLILRPNHPATWLVEARHLPTTGPLVPYEPFLSRRPHVGHRKADSRAFCSSVQLNF